METSRLLARNMSFREVSPITGDSIDKLQSILLKQNGKEPSHNDTIALKQDDISMTIHLSMKMIILIT